MSNITKQSKKVNENKVGVFYTEEQQIAMQWEEYTRQIAECEEMMQDQFLLHYW